MESALYSIFTLVFVSESSLVRCAHSFDFWYANLVSKLMVKSFFGK